MIKCDLKDIHKKNCGCLNTTFRWINEDKKAIFFEIPKNASTSMKNILKKNGFVLLEDKFYKDNYNQYYKFCIYRNPCDRFVSNYLMFCTNTGKKVLSNQLKLLFGKTNINYTFEEFAEKIYNVKNHHYEQQIEFLKDDNDELVYIDFILYLDGRFDDDFKKLKRKLNFKGEIEHIHKSNRKHWFSYYNNKTMKLINDFYRDDFTFPLDNICQGVEKIETKC